VSYLTYLLGFWTCSPQVKLVFTVSFPSLVITRFPVREYSGPRSSISAGLHSGCIRFTGGGKVQALGRVRTKLSGLTHDQFWDSLWQLWQRWFLIKLLRPLWVVQCCTWMKSKCMQSYAIPLAIISSLALDMLWTLCGCGCHVVPCHICQSVKGSQGSQGSQGLLQASCVAPI